MPPPCRWKSCTKDPQSAARVLKAGRDCFMRCSPVCRARSSVRRGLHVTWDGGIAPGTVFPRDLPVLRAEMILLCLAQSSRVPEKQQASMIRLCAPVHREILLRGGEVLVPRSICSVLMSTPDCSMFVARVCRHLCRNQFSQQAARLHLPLEVKQNPQLSPPAERSSCKVPGDERLPTPLRSSAGSGVAESETLGAPGSFFCGLSIPR